MEDERVSFETAKLAKEKGFNVWTEAGWYECEEHNQMQHGHGKYHDDEMGYKLLPHEVFSFQPYDRPFVRYARPTQ